MAVEALYLAALGIDLTKLEAGIASARQKLAAMGTGVPTTGMDSFVNRANASFGSLRTQIGNVGSAMTAFGGSMTLVTLPMAGLVGLAAKLGIGFDSLKQQAMIAFTSMLGGADQAKKMMEDLTSFAATTPFELKGLIPLTQQLIAFGFKGEEIIPMLTGIGDAIAGLGRGEPEMQRLIMNLGQIKAVGHVTGRELRDMSTLGINALQILADSMGKTTEQTQGLVSKGLIPADFAIKAIIDGLEKGTTNTVAFGGMMEKQSHTLKGIFSNLKDVADKTLGAIFQPLVDKATPALEGVLKKLQEFGVAVEKLGLLKAISDLTGFGEGFIKAAAAIAGITLVAGPAALAVGLIATAFGALLGPIGLVAVAVGALATAYVSDFGTMNTTINNHFALFKQLLGETSAASFEFSDQWARVGIGMDVVLDKILLSLERLMVQTVTAAKIMFEALKGDWSGVIAAYQEGQNKLAAIDVVAAKNLAERNRARTDIEMREWARHYDERGKQSGVAGSKIADIFLSEFGKGTPKAITISAKMGAEVATAASEAYRKGLGTYKETYENALAEALQKAGVKAKAEQVALGRTLAVDFASSYRNSLTGLELGLTMQQALMKYAGPTREALRAMGKGHGEAEKQGYLSSIFKSPHYIFTTTMQAISDVAADAPGRLSSAMKTVGDAAGKAFKDGLNEAMKGITEGIEKVFRDAQIDKVLVQKIQPIVDSLKQMGGEFIKVVPAAVGFSSALSAIPTAKVGAGLDLLTAKLAALIATEKAAAAEANAWAQGTVDAAKRIDDAITNSATVMHAQATVNIGQSAQSVVDLFARMGEQAGLTGKALIDFIQRKLSQLGPGLKAAGVDIEKFGVAVGKAFSDFVRLPGIWDTVFKNSTAQVKGWVGDILNVVGTMPTKFGEHLNKIRSQVESWLTFLNSILGIVHRIFNQVPGTLTGVIDAIVNVFKGSKAPIQSALSGSLSGAVTGAAQSATSAASSAGASVGASVSGGIASGLATAAAGMSVVGGIIAVIDFALKYFQDPSKAKRYFSGGIFSLIFGGPSPLQQAELDARMQRAKDAIKLSIESVVQAVEASKQAVLATGSKVADLMAQLFNYVKVPKGVIKAFVKNMGDLFVFLAAEIKRLAPEALLAIKNASESLSPAADLLSKMPLVFQGINGHIALAQGQVDLYFRDWDTLIARLGISAEATPKKLLKHIKKFSILLSPAADLMSKVTGGLKDMFDLKPVPVQSFDIWESSLDTFTQRLGEMAERFKKSFVKNLSFFAEQVGPGVALWKDATDAIRAMFDLPQPSAKDYETLFTGLDIGLSKSMELAAKYTKEALAWTVEFFGYAKDIYAGVLGGVEVINAVNKAETVDVARWGIFADAIRGMADFVHRALGDLLRARDDSIVMVGASREFHDNILATALNVTNAATQAAAMFRGAGFAGDGSFNVTGGVGALALPSGGNLGSLSAPLSGGFSGGFSAPSGGTTTHSSVTNVVNVAGVHVNADDPKGRAFLRALADLLGPSSGLRSIVNQND